MATPQQKAAYRRRCKPGFPKDFVFTSYSDLQKYFGFDRIQCLRCGKQMRSLGVHLKTIHGLEPDEYRAMYGIPWTYGLICGQTEEIWRGIAIERGLGDGGPTAEVREKAALGRTKQRERQPVRADLCRLNVAKAQERNRAFYASRPVVAKPQKPVRKPRPKPARKGTPEFHEKMKKRPQCASPDPAFVYWWVGKKQSQDHIRKRTVHAVRELQGKATDGTAQS